MLKRVLIVGGFTVMCVVALYALCVMKGHSTSVLEKAADIAVAQNVSDSVHSYAFDGLKEECATQDGIFCAIEQVVKCTIKPDFAGCDREYVPGFVLGKIEEAQRPTEISFAVTKIKPIPGGNDISVYTTSDCDAIWFGLCKGTVIYSLTRKGERWAVTNIYAREV